MLWAEDTMGMEIFLATPDGYPSLRGSNGILFHTFGDIVNLGAR
jgi:hypothetical protein